MEEVAVVVGERSMARMARLAVAVAGALAAGLAGCGSGNAGDFIWGRSASFTPDGAHLVYAQNLSSPSDRVTTVITDLDAGDIWRAQADGSNPTRITPSDRGPDFFPQVSPDGTRIVYVSGEGRQFDIWVMDIDGRNRRPLTSDQAVDNSPTWAGNDRVIFSSDRSGNSDLWSIRADGSGLTQLTSFPSDEAAPAVNKNGEIAFVSNKDRSNFDLWVMDGNGANLRQLTSKPESASRVSDGGPAWSPDGARIAFERWDGDWNVFAIQPDGSGLTQLTTNNEHDGDPVYSPDGQTIAFTSARSGWWQIWAMNPDGSGQRQLTGR